jgi:hypothetical protein
VVAVFDARAERVVPLLCPFDLQVWVVDRMLNFEIADDPDYGGLELQVFDDSAHGRGMIVLLKRRRDGRIDIYRQPGLTLDPELAQVGGELGAWVEADIDRAQFDIGPDGVDVDVRLADLAGRDIRVRIDDRDGRRRRRGTLLAPVGSAIERPVSLPLFVMGGCDLVRRTGGAFEIRIGGRTITIGRLPGSWLHRRRLVKYTADPTVVVFNRAHDGPVGAAGIQARPSGWVEATSGATGIAGLRACGGGHRPPRARAGPARPGRAGTRDERGRRLAAGRRPRPLRGRRDLDRPAAPGPCRPGARRRPWLAAQRAAAADGGRDPGRPGFPELADDLPLDGHAATRRPADAAVAVGAEGRPA